MISGLVILNEAERFCYPYLESIESLLPVCDEMVCVMNPYNPEYEKTREKLVALSPKIRIVHAVFDLFKYGWISYGIARTTGYQACKGDIVMMFDADGVLHENDVDLLKERLNWLNDDTKAGDKVRAYWGKYRLYKTNLYRMQWKHSGIYNKRRLGDRLDFYDSSGKGIPNYKYLKDWEKSIQFPVKLFGYEHFWDTEEIILEKTRNYGKMNDMLNNRPVKSQEEYFMEYRERLVRDMVEKGITQEMNHPKIMQRKLAELSDKHFSYNFFEDLYARFKSAR